MKNILIGLTVFGLALGIGLFSVSYATNLTVNEVIENAENTIDTQLDEMEAMVFGDNPKFDDDDYDQKGFEMKSEYHSQKAVIFEDNQVTQEEIDSITYTKLKEKLLEEYATELEDGVITEEELTAHKEAKKAEHEAMHAEKDAIFEDNQVTQEEIDALTNTKLKDHLTEEYASELEDGVISEDELKSGHENHKGKGHKKGRGMHGHDHNDHDHDDDDYDDDDDE
jgi:type II secretory pathway pseudopilin PulG